MKRARWRQRFATIVAGLLVVLGSVAALMPSGSAGRTHMVNPLPTAAGSGAWFDYLVLIIMENHNLCDIWTGCGGTATYMSNLADTYGLAQAERYCHVNPSLPNYLCLTGGSDFGCPGYDGNPNSNACTGAAWNAPSIVDRLEAGGLSWKAYAEDMPSACYGTNAGLYAVRHNPFVYYNSIAGNGTRCARVVPAGTSGNVLIGDLQSTTTASRYMWLSPNTCNDMHDGGANCGVSHGDAYLSTLVPQILNSTIFTTTRAALLITFDEGYGQPVYTVWAGPTARRAFTSTVAYDHFSILATIEANWNLTRLTSNDVAASTMNEFFLAGSPRVPAPQGPSVLLFFEISSIVVIALVAAGLLVSRRRKRERNPPP